MNDLNGFPFFPLYDGGEWFLTLNPKPLRHRSLHNRGTFCRSQISVYMYAYEDRKTHTRTRTHTHTQTHRHIYMCTPMPISTSHSLSFSHSLALSPPIYLPHTHTHTHTNHGECQVRKQQRRNQTSRQSTPNRHYFQTCLSMLTAKYHGPAGSRESSPAIAAQSFRCRADE